MDCRSRLLKTIILFAGVILWIGSAAAAPLPLPASVPAGAPFAAAAIGRPLAITKIICDHLRPLAAFGHFLEG
jgi:hypothetical protein